MKLLLKIMILFSILFFCMIMEVSATAIPNDVTIYYDNSVTQWSTVTIYIWGNESPEYYKTWNSAFMTMSCEDNICSYKLTHDDRIYNKIIFRGTNNDTEKTVDLIYRGENYIFKGENTGNSVTGSWYYKESGELQQEKVLFNKLESFWYTGDSYEALKSSILAIPSVYNNSYLLANDSISNYEMDLSKSRLNFQNLVLSSNRLITKVNELEAKNMTGYTWESVNAFRNQIKEVNDYIDADDLTLETLKINYNKLVNANKLLVIETEDGKNVVIETIKGDIEKLEELLNSNSMNINEIIKFYDELESSYKILTIGESELLNTVNQILKSLVNNNGTEIAVLKRYLSEELLVLRELLGEDNIKVDELVNKYEDIEAHYKSLLDENNEIKELILNIDRKVSNYWVFYIVSGILVINSSVTILLLFRKKKIIKNI